MRLLLRILLHLATALSLLLALALTTLWIRSHYVWEDLYVLYPPAYTATHPWPYVSDLRSSAGGLAIGLLRPHTPLPPTEFARTQNDFPRYMYGRGPTPPTYPQTSLGHLPPFWRSLGLDAESYDSTTEFATYTCHRIILPYRLLVLLFALLPAIRLSLYLRRRRHRKRNPLLCPTCGYDLRASPTQCPECGTAVAPANRTAPAQHA